MAAPLPPSSSPQPAYHPPENIGLPRHLTSAVASAPRTLLSTHTLPVRSGHAWPLLAGQVCRISTPQGPQVGDLNLWSLRSPRSERFWASRTRQIHASHVSVGDRLWSCLPHMRPMATIVADSLGGVKYGVDGVDGDGARCHDLLGTRCDPYINKVLTGQEFDFHCHSNLTRAVLPFGLCESDVHDVLNVFQVTGLDKNGRYFMKPCPAKPGDYFEFFAEIDLLCALSTCPGGDLSRFGWGKGKGSGSGETRESDESNRNSNFDDGGGDADDMLECCRPLQIDVFSLKDTSALAASWVPPEPASYAGLHGLKMPVFGER